ncbi:hypothetical protein DUNSADRAFT_4421 [Dunaliella salina]|uniref:Uncharacterized protein n=1 Tax=Dunaliella salina TaxID=3046 RepID=A0ABQ7GS56_DUNSA|nr:hypothetical protein DUNSADRAFT_4421 [Dunaliella salina]|eukprot:KAF5837441.1 hypothetical protein DUNSADRAFT_4421 [Dunaliella salina]
MGSRGPHRRAWQWHIRGTGRITKGRSFGLPRYDWQQLSMLVNSQRQAQGCLPHTPPSHKQPLSKDALLPTQLCREAEKENCSMEQPLPTPSHSPRPAPMSLAAPAPPPSQTAEQQESFLLEPSAFQRRRTARLGLQKGTGRATQLRGYRLLLALPPPPPPILVAPSPPPAPAPDPSVSPSVSSLELLPPPESPHFLTHHSPMEGVPERITPSRPLLPPRTPLSALPLALSAPGSPLRSSGSASMYSWPTPMEGVPERSLGLTGQRPPRPKLSPLPPTPVACTPVEGVPEIGEWGRMPQAPWALLQRNRSSSVGGSRLARALLTSRGPTPAATPLLGPDRGKSAACETPHPGSLSRQGAGGNGGHDAQAGTTSRPTPKSAAARAFVGPEGERRMSTQLAAADGDPGGNPAALFAEVAGCGGEAAGGQEEEEFVVGTTAGAATPLGGPEGVASKELPQSRSCQPGSPAQLGAPGLSNTAAVGRVHGGCAHAGVAQRTPAGGTTPFELVLVGSSSGDGRPWGGAAPNANASGAPWEASEVAPAAQSTPVRAVDIGAQTGLSLGRPARASDGAPHHNRSSSGMATPAASLRAPAVCSLFDVDAGPACSPLARALPHQPPRTGMRVRAAVGANRSHGGGRVALARPGEVAYGGASDDGAQKDEDWGGWPSCPGTAETIRSLHLEEELYSSGGGAVGDERQGQGSGLGKEDDGAGRSGGGQLMPRADDGHAATHLMPTRAGESCAAAHLMLCADNHAARPMLHADSHAAARLVLTRANNQEAARLTPHAADGHAAHLMLTHADNRASHPVLHACDGHAATHLMQTCANDEGVAAGEPTFGDVGAMHGSISGSQRCNGQEVVHAAAVRDMDTVHGSLGSHCCDEREVVHAAAVGDAGTHGSSGSRCCNGREVVHAMATADVGAILGSFGSQCCNGREVVHAAAAGREADRGGGCGSGGNGSIHGSHGGDGQEVVVHAAAAGGEAEREEGCGSGGRGGCSGSGGSYGGDGVDGGDDVRVDQGCMGGSCVEQWEQGDDMDVEQQQQQQQQEQHDEGQEDDMDVEQQQQQQRHDEEDGGARHYGDDEHDEVVGGGRMDELDGQQHAPARQKGRRSAAPRQQRHQGNGRRSAAQEELARQKSLTARAHLNNRNKGWLQGLKGDLREATQWKLTNVSSHPVLNLMHSHMPGFNKLERLPFDKQYVPRHP